MFFDISSNSLLCVLFMSYTMALKFKGDPVEKFTV